MEPINYSRDVLNPIEGYLQGIKFGEGINTDRLNQEATRNTMQVQQGTLDLAERQFQAEQAEIQRQNAAAQAEVAAQRARAEEGTMALMSYLDGLEAGTATAADLRRGMAAFPEMADQFQAFASSVSEERLGNELSFGKQLAFTLANGNTEAAEGLLRTRQEAAEAAGDEQGAAVYKAQLIELAQNPNGVLMQTLLPIMSNMDPEEFDTFHTDILGLGGGDGDVQTRSSQILVDGTVVQSTDKGTRVFGPNGDRLEGEAAAEAIRKARELEVEQERLINEGRRTGTLQADAELGGEAAGAEALGRLSMEAGVAAYDDISKVNSSLSNINEAIAAIDDGAAAGLVANYFPNITEASASLNNAMNRMGLDVISSVTFGALSEAEMTLAMETAVPRNLRPPELRAWLVKKRQAQEKARDALTNAARYLTTPGNTINTWLEEQSQGGDAQGSGEVAATSEIDPALLEFMTPEERALFE